MHSTPARRAWLREKAAAPIRALTDTSGRPRYVRREGERQRTPGLDARAKNGPDGQRVAEEEREHDRDRDRGDVALAERACGDHPEDLADCAAGHAVKRRLRGAARQRRLLVHVRL